VPVNVARVQTDSREVNQLQQNIITALVPFVNGLEVPRRYAAAALPTPEVNLAGKLIRVYDQGAAETLQMCLARADGSYGWAIIAIAP
jgi:hypothetical protein